MVAAYSMCELGSRGARERALLDLWNKSRGYLVRFVLFLLRYCPFFFLNYVIIDAQVLIELGNAEGFHAISQAREYLLNLANDDDVEDITADEGESVNCLIKLFFLR